MADGKGSSDAPRTVQPAEHADSGDEPGHNDLGAQPPPSRSEPGSLPHADVRLNKARERAWRGGLPGASGTRRFPFRARKGTEEPMFESYRARRFGTKLGAPTLLQ